MAATRLIAIHKAKGKTFKESIKARIDYIVNGEKTDNGKYISAYECSPLDAHEEFEDDKIDYERMTGRKPRGDIIAYQIRQAFKPGEITPEEANRLGYETAMRFTKGNNAFIVATHTDKAHIHNHIIFNAVNLKHDRKFRNSWFCGLGLQKLSDHVCLENGLSVIKPVPPSQRQKRTTYPMRLSYREQIRADIDEILKSNPKSVDEFYELLSKKYQIKRGNHVAVKGDKQNRFIRLESLGDGYTLSDIRKIIDGATKPPYKFDMLLDVQEKMKKGIGLGNWAHRFNTKQMAITLLFLEDQGVRSYEELAQRATSATARFEEIRSKIKACEKQLKELGALRQAIIDYSKTRETYIEYRKGGYNKKFFETHRADILLHQAAKKKFDTYEGKIPKVKQINEEYQRILAEKNEAYKDYRKAKEEMQSYVKAKYNIDEFNKPHRSEEIKRRDPII